MRVEAGEGEPWFHDAEVARKIRRRDAGLGDNFVGRQLRGNIFQRNVDGYGNGSEIFGHQHHHLLHRQSLPRAEMGEIVGVALVAKARRVECVLMDRIGDDARNLAAQRQFHGFVDGGDHLSCRSGMNFAGQRLGLQRAIKDRKCG